MIGKSDGIYSRMYREMNERSVMVIYAEDEFIDQYNEIAKNSGCLQAVAVLSSVRVEVTREYEYMMNNIQEFIDRIRSYISVDESDNVEKQNLSEAIEISITHTFPTSGIFPSYSTDKDTFIRYITEYSKLIDNQAVTGWKDRVNQAYRDKEVLEGLEIQKQAIENILSKIVRNQYPEELEKETISLNQREENKDRPGRPFDESVDQSKIESLVKILLEKASIHEDGFEKYIHQDGMYEGKPNKNQIKEAIIKEGIGGDLSDKTILNRIDMALETLGRN